MTTSDGASGDWFGSGIEISGETLLVGAYGKDGRKGSAYVLVFAGDVSWDEGTMLIPINGTASGYEFGWSVALSGDRDLIGAIGSDEEGKG